MKMKTTNELLIDYRDFMVNMISFGLARFEYEQRSKATKRGIALAKARKLKNGKVEKTA